MVTLDWHLSVFRQAQKNGHTGSHNYGWILIPVSVLYRKPSTLNIRALFFLIQAAKTTSYHPGPGARPLGVPFINA